MGLSVTLTVSPSNRWLDRGSPGKDNFLVSTTIRLLSVAMAVATFVFGALLKLESLNPIVASIVCWPLAVSSASRALSPLSRERSLRDVSCNLAKQISMESILHYFYYLISTKTLLGKVVFSVVIFHIELNERIHK